MLYQRFQETYAQLTELGANLLQYLIEFREGRQGLDGASLDSVQNDIQKALTALKESRYEVAVVAPMKAGKSTFLNSMIGADLLASESAACTICRTEVRHIRPDQTPRLLEYWDHSSKGEVLVEGNAEVIQQKFLARTRELRTNRENNPETAYPKKFELWHPIEAVQDLPALSGFTLIDTPGPNEWEAGTLSREMVALKEATLAALRQCNVVIFVLNYRSARDNASDELFKAITQGRQELLQNNKARIYFILNQVDLRAERDPSIEQTLDNLRIELSRFGFHNPEIYPASAFQGLLSKLILSGVATEGQITDFRRFFAAKFVHINEDGDQIIPAPHRIAPFALKDSNIPEVQTKVFATIIQSAGWNLLCDVLAQFDKSAGAIEDTLNTEIAGWKQNIATLERRVKEYSQRAESARKKLETVKAKVNQQEVVLVEGFGIAIDTFAKVAKRQIEQEIENVVVKRQAESQASQEKTQATGNFILDILNAAKEVARRTLVLLPVPQFVPKLVDLVGASVIGVSRSLLDYLCGSMPDLSNGSSPYVFRFSEAEQAHKFFKQINDFCVPHIQDWWVGVQDRLVSEGTQIREDLANVIRHDVQEISDELSSYLGEALEVKFNNNPIQFPSFDFKGLDAQIHEVHELYDKTTKRRKFFNLFTYDEPVKASETRKFYEVDLNQVLERIRQRIDNSSELSKKTLKRVIKLQIKDDFRSAKKQLEDYINRFDQQLKGLLEDRQAHAERTPEKIAALEQAQTDLKGLLTRLEQMQETLKCQ
ncbi:MAG: dynamin family protein [Leptolyngbyaceae cyanobacterium CSU_1_3]|nr:dynamin family protein [Leptolyngbyaceae cyanobacterium CSU_1_3]